MPHIWKTPLFNLLMGRFKNNVVIANLGEPYVQKIIAFLSQFAKKEQPVYNLKSVKIPRTSGRTLKILAFLLRIPGTRSLLIPLLLRQAGIQSLRKCKVEDEPLMHPVHPADE